MTLGYFVFALGCILLILSSFWLKISHRTADVRVRKLREVLGSLCRLYRIYAKVLGLAHISYEGIGTIESGLIVSNHPSLIDVLWLVAAMPQVCCVLKAEINNNYLLRPLVKDLDYLSNSDPEKLLDEGASRIKAGEVLLIFPEATRTPPGTIPKFRLGAAELLVRTGAQAHVLLIKKSHIYLSKMVPWYAFPPEPLRYEISRIAHFEPCLVGSRRTLRRQVNSCLLYTSPSPRDA